MSEHPRGNPDGQRSPENLVMLPKGNLKGCPYLLKDELSEKKTSQAEQRNLTITQGKKGEERSQEEYIDL